MNNKAPNGYVKVCSSWLKRLWGVDSEEKKLNAPTNVFDACGAYDFKNGGNPISKGSKFEAWSDALNFLEWYGVPLMDGFGIIIIDNESDGNPYQKVNADVAGYTEECFNSGMRLALSAVSVVSLTALALY
jgi:hypothetical protein